MIINHLQTQNHSAWANSLSVWVNVQIPYADNRQAWQHEAWERMRILATITIQPHVKNHLTPASLLPFPWDNQPHPNNTQAAREPIPTKEEAHERLVTLIKKMKN